MNTDTKSDKGSKGNKGSLMPMMFEPDFLDNLVMRTHIFLIDHFKANGEDHLASLLDSMAVLLIYQINVKEDGMVDFLQWQAAAEAIGDISQLYKGEPL